MKELILNDPKMRKIIKAAGGFSTCQNKGFHITFPNGVTLSTQFGGGNYCDNYGEPIGTLNLAEALKQRWSSNAEIAIFNGDDWLTKKMIKALYPKGGYPNDVKGYVDIKEWLKIFDWCRKQRRKKPCSASKKSAI